MTDRTSDTIIDEACAILDAIAPVDLGPAMTRVDRARRLLDEARAARREEDDRPVSVCRFCDRDRAKCGCP